MAWSWGKHQMTREEVLTRGNIIKCETLKNLNDPPIEWDKVRRHQVLLITGDGNSLIEDVTEFESWNIPHDLYCVNRSLLFFQRQVDHWAAIDSEESTWFVENVNTAVEPEKPILRHTIGWFPGAYDVFWEQDFPFENEMQRRIWIGNSGYFAVLTALHMGYDKIALAGMPLNHEPHWYEDKNEPPPQWAGLAFSQWIDFKIGRPEAQKVKAIVTNEPSYSGFILGKATREWING